MIDKGQRLHPGDILRNDWASEDNPHLYTMYIKRGKVGSHPTIDCLGFDGRIAHHGAQDNRLVVVGHLKEYDEFIKALSCIRTYEEQETIERTKGEWPDETLPVLRNKEREYSCDHSRRDKA